MRPTLLLGGSGGTGSLLAQQLLREHPAPLVVAGRDLARAQAVASRLDHDFPGRCTARALDAADPAQLLAAVREAGLVVDATTNQAVDPLIDALVATGCDALDLHAHPSVIHRYDARAAELAAAGCSVVTQAGFHPGLPAAVVRDAATRIPRIQRATVAMAMGLRGATTEAMLELLDLVPVWPSDLYERGAWRAATWRDRRRVDLGPRFGAQWCYPISLAEMHPLPAALGIAELATVVAGFGWFVDGVVLPLSMLRARLGTRVGRTTLARLAAWALRHGGASDGVTFVCDAAGEGSDGAPRSERLTLEHGDAYAFTAIPAAACALQLLDGSIRAPGVRAMGLAVDPARLLADLRRMGVSIATGGAPCQGEGGRR